MIIFTVHDDDRVAVSDNGTLAISGGEFFLDFSRPLTEGRRFSLLGVRFGQVTRLLVPVVHRRESRPTGDERGYVIDVNRETDLRLFGDQGYVKPDTNAVDFMLSMWRADYPAPHREPTDPADGLTIIADFAKQFPTHVN